MAYNLVSFDDILHVTHSDDEDPHSKTAQGSGKEDLNSVDSDGDYDESSDFVPVEEIIKYYAKKKSNSSATSDGLRFQEEKDELYEDWKIQKAENYYDNPEECIEDYENIKQDYTLDKNNKCTPGISLAKSKSLESNRPDSHGISKEEKSKSLDSQTRDLSRGFMNLSEQGWFWGAMRYEDAEQVLAGRPDGSFLVRDSTNSFDLLVVSVRSQSTTIHVRVMYTNGCFHLSHGDQGYESVVELIESVMEVSRHGVYRHTAFGGRKPVRLLTPMLTDQVRHPPIRDRSGEVVGRRLYADDDEGIWADPRNL
ncbi:uncharacterized protein LOC125572149 [Nematostella vectensis]|uniref:uncharacterized protein LOC125572149 n=1 Tax=Nematostella vectensis TaxID=45351 RepID=UPI0020772465|nr:uncharacterized protein LOC125572149 [Nematostella vectensis]